jgi:hypothetical protein
VRLDGGAPFDGFGEPDMNSSFEIERNFIGVGFPVVFPLIIGCTVAAIVILGIFLVFLYSAVGSLFFGCFVPNLLLVFKPLFFA